MHINIFLHFRIKVRIGADRRSQERGVQTVDVVKVIRHESYQPAPKFYHDIGLLKLKNGFWTGKL